MTRRLPLLIGVLLVFGCAQPRPIADRFQGVVAAVEEASFISGDDARWAAPSWNDSEWQRGLLYWVRPDRKTFWIRDQVMMPAPKGEFTPAVYVSIQGSLELFWDGRRIGTSGAIGPDGSAVKAGPMDNFFPIPVELAGPGPHALAMRVAVTPDRLRAPWFHGIAIGDHTTMFRSRIVSQVVPLAGVGIFTIIGIYCFVMFLAAGRRRSLLAFSLLCLFSALLALVETWRWTVGYSSDLHGLRMDLVTALTLAVAFLFAAFVILDLQVRRPWLWTGLAGAVLVALLFIPTGSDEHCLLLFWASILMAGIAVIAARDAPRRRRVVGAGGVLVMGLALVRGGYGFSDSIFFVAFAIVILSLLVSLALEMRDERRLRQEALLRATRLELELLQKSVQPHFLMNTLMAVMEWLEEDPPAGLAFLEALADELRLFEAMSHETLVPVRQELELCRLHLDLMQCRKGTRFELDCDSVDADAEIPPALFHTLIENAMTHNRYREPSASFRLREQRVDGVRRYLFDAPLAKPVERDGEGTGLRYVKARLEESFPGRWRLEGGVYGSSWRTIVEVPV